MFGLLYKGGRAPLDKPRAVSGGRPAGGRRAAGAAGAVRRTWAALPKTPQITKRALSLLASLNDLGWHRSARARMATDADGNPLPWYTYSAILWLGPRLRAADRVFEFGSGSSTRWYAARVRDVVAVEHDEAWAERMQPLVPSNARVLHRRSRGGPSHAPPDDAYVRALAEESHEPFDVVVVDGVARVACIEAAIEIAGPATLVLLDNADRPAYAGALLALKAARFQRIDFMGPVPGSGRLSFTSVFARDLSRWVAEHPALPQVGYDARGSDDPDV